MSSRKYRSEQNVTAFFLATVFLAQSCGLQFFPIYLKYLNFTAIEVGIIRASQTWISMLLVTVWLFITKPLQSVNLKRSVISVFLVVNITLLLCLTFLPRSNMLKDVTHCHGYVSHPSMEEVVKPHHNKQWDNFETIPQVPSHTANVIMTRPTIKTTHANKESIANLSLSSSTNGNASLPSSMAIKPASFSTVIYHDSTKLVSNNSNISSQNNSKVLPISTTKQNKVVLDSTIQLAKNISFSPNIRDISRSTTEQALLPEAISDVSLVSTVKPYIPTLINDKSSTENNKYTSTSAENENKIIQTPIFEELDYSSTHKIQRPLVMNTSIHGDSNVTEKLDTTESENLGNYAHTLTHQNKTKHTSNSMKAMFTLLNRTLSKIHSQNYKFMSNEKSVDQRANTEEQDDSTEKVHESGSDSEDFHPLAENYHDTEVLPPNTDNVRDHVNLNNKIWHYRSHTSQSELRNAHSNQKLHYPTQESEGRHVPIVSERSKADETKFYEIELPKHTVFPSVQHKNRMRYYDQNNGLKNVPQVASENIRTGNVEDYSSDKRSTNRLQPDIVAGTEDTRGISQDVENQINISNKPDGGRLWDEYQHFLDLLRQYEGGRKIEQKYQEENPFPTAEEEKDLSAVRRMQKNIKQEKDFDPNDRKRVSRSLVSESQEEEERSISKKLTRKHPTHHTRNHIYDYNKRNTKHKRSQAPQSSSYAKTVNYRGKLKTKDVLTMQGTMRRLMFAELSKPKHYDDTDLQVDEVLMPRLDQNISIQLWNIIAINKFPGFPKLSTTFSIILVLAVLAEVFFRVISATSCQFLQYEEFVRASGHKPVTPKNYHQQVYALLAWGLFGCPLLAGLVLATECTYQPRVFLLFSTGLLLMALLSFFLLHLPGKSWDWKLQDYGNEEKQDHTSLLQRFGYYTSTFFTGFAMACNLEFILWHIENLHGFPYNYQLLYCSYVGIGSLVQALVRSWLQRRQLSALVDVQDYTSPGDHSVHMGAADGLWSIGPILLGLHFLAASLLHPAWILVFLGILQGCSAAFVFPAKNSGWWATGYGLGSIVGGVMVDAHGAEWLFWIMAGSMFVWSAMVTLCGGMLKCIGDYDRGRASYSQLLLPEGDSDNEEVMVFESEDWLERALQKDEQQETQRRRIMSCPT